MNPNLRPDDFSIVQAFERLCEESENARLSLRDEFSEAAYRDKICRYPGQIGVCKKFGLTPMERWIEAHCAQFLEDHLKTMISDYYKIAEKKFGYDRYVSADLAREVFPCYQTPLDKQVFYRAVSRPAMKLAAIIFCEYLNRKQKKHVAFFTGGTSSGKSRVAGEILKVAPEDTFVCEKVITDYEVTRDILLEALKQSKKVSIYYVDCPLEIAAQRNIARAQESGDIFNMNMLACMHDICLEVLKELYKNDRKIVDFKIIANGDAQSGNISLGEFFAKINWTRNLSLPKMIQQSYDILNQSYERGLRGESSPLPAWTYRQLFYPDGWIPRSKEQLNQAIDGLKIPRRFSNMSPYIAQSVLKSSIVKK